MGSGGLRGLQIPRSGAHHVRGGFDSHAFPPLLALLLCGALLLASGIAAAADQVQTLPPPSEATLDSLAADTLAASGTLRLRPVRWSDQPRYVMFRSLLVPGWGQWYNRSWIKALAVAGGEATFAVQLVDDHRALDRLKGDVDAAARRGDAVGYAEAVNRYNARLEPYIQRQWLLGAVIAYAMLDAYVDAHFRNFDIEFQTDPALPGGKPPATGARISYRWSF